MNYFSVQYTDTVRNGRRYTAQAGTAAAGLTNSNTKMPIATTGNDYATLSSLPTRRKSVRRDRKKSRSGRLSVAGDRFLLHLHQPSNWLWLYELLFFFAINAVPQNHWPTLVVRLFVRSTILIRTRVYINATSCFVI